MHQVKKSTFDIFVYSPAAIFKTIEEI